jgi:hypothetical protein
MVSKLRASASLSMVVLLLAAACSVEGGTEPGLGRVTQAQDNFTPTSCTGSEVPGGFIESCLLNGGESVHCDGGVAYCCRACHPGEAGGCDEYCSQNPDDLSRASTVPVDPVVIDTVKDADPPRWLPPPLPPVGKLK